jgi:hypothetical protein
LNRRNHPTYPHTYRDAIFHSWECGSENWSQVILGRKVLVHRSGALPRKKTLGWSLVCTRWMDMET